MKFTGQNPVDSKETVRYNEYRKSAVPQRLAPRTDQLKEADRLGATGRSARFWGYVDHHPKDDEKTHREAKGFRPSPVSHRHHLPSNGIRRENGAFRLGTALGPFRGKDIIPEMGKLVSFSELLKRTADGDHQPSFF